MVDKGCMALRLQTPRRPVRRSTPYAANAFPASAFAPRAVPANEYPSPAYSTPYPTPGYPMDAYAQGGAHVQHYGANAYTAQAFSTNSYAPRPMPAPAYAPSGYAGNGYPTGYGTQGVVAGRNVAMRRGGAAAAPSPGIPAIVWILLAMAGVAIIMLVIAINHNKAQEAANIATLERGLKRQAAAQAHNERMWQQMEEDERREAEYRAARRAERQAQNR